MDREPGDRRKAQRYPIQADAIVHTSNGRTIPARATNISSYGMLLHIEQSSALAVDEQVTVEIELPNDPEKTFSSWGVARVVRIDGSNLGVQLYAGTFDSD